MSTVSKILENSEIEVSPDRNYQRTLSKEILLRGNALFTGAEAVVTLTPAPINTGILFQRVDLDHSTYIAAKLENVDSTPRCTKLGLKEKSIQTVEHLLAALRAFGIDNLFIKVHGPEVPIFDGSSLAFIEKIEETGVAVQSEKRMRYRLEKAVYYSHDDIHLVAIPSDEFRISYTLHFPSCALIGSQYYSYVLDPLSFKTQIAPSRTFAVYEEIAPWIEKGFIRGGALDNAVVIKDEKIINKDGLRFKDEMVRHKILDLIGDLSLIGKTFSAHIIAIRSGHATNIAFARKLTEYIKMEGSDGI